MFTYSDLLCKICFNSGFAGASWALSPGLIGLYAMEVLGANTRLGIIKTLCSPPIPQVRSYCWGYNDEEGNILAEINMSWYGDNGLGSNRGRINHNPCGRQLRQGRAYRRFRWILRQSHRTRMTTYTR